MHDFLDVFHCPISLNKHLSISLSLSPAIWFSLFTVGFWKTGELIQENVYSSCEFPYRIQRSPPQRPTKSVLWRRELFALVKVSWAWSWWEKRRVEEDEEEGLESRSFLGWYDKTQCYRDGTRHRLWPVWSSFGPGSRAPPAYHRWLVSLPSSLRKWFPCFLFMVFFLIWKSSLVYFSHFPILGWLIGVGNAYIWSLNWKNWRPNMIQSTVSPSALLFFTVLSNII